MSAWPRYYAEQSPSQIERTTKLWHAALEPLKAKAAKLALTYYMREGQYPPAPADIYTRAMEFMTPQDDKVIIVDGKPVVIPGDQVDEWGVMGDD